MGITSESFKTFQELLKYFSSKPDGIGAVLSGAKSLGSKETSDVIDSLINATKYLSYMAELVGMPKSGPLGIGATTASLMNNLVKIQNACQDNKAPGLDDTISAIGDFSSLAGDISLYGISRLPSFAPELLTIGLVGKSASMVLGYVGLGTIGKSVSPEIASLICQKL